MMDKYLSRLHHVVFLFCFGVLWVLFQPFLSCPVLDWQVALCNLPQVTGLHCGLTRIDLTSEQSFLLAHGRNIEFYLHQHKNNGKIPFACSFSSKCQYYSSFQFKHSFCEVLIFLNHHLIHCKCNGINHF